MKGVLFTIGLVSMAAVILGLAFGVMQSGNREQMDVVQLLMFDRMRGDAAWIEAGFRDIVRAADINISVINKTVAIEESNPNFKAQNISTNVDKWIIFAGNNTGFTSAFNVQDIKNSLTVSFPPSLVRYSHPNGPTGDTIRVEGSGQVSNYSIELDIGLAEPISLSWSPLDTSPPSLGFRIKVSNTTDSVEEIQYVDMDDTSSLDVSLSSGTVTIDVGDATDRGLLEISNPSSLNMTVFTNMTFSFINEPYATFPGKVVSLYSEHINATYGGPVTLA
jgi:hypothetical protein